MRRSSCRRTFLAIAMAAGVGCASKGPGLIGGPFADDGGQDGGGAAADAGPIAPPAGLVPWGNVNKQPAAWYAGPAAAYIADNVLYYQNGDGGWPKNVDMTNRSAAKTASTIDNSSTTMELIFLARVYGAAGNAAYRDAFMRGLDYLFAAQYPNGGWPQYFPNPSDYHRHITFNDGAMTHVLYLLRDVSARLPLYNFVDEARAARALVAVDKGIACILACQIVVAGQKTGWCAQHDEVTLAPAQARAYELPSESGQEGAGVLDFLMSIDNPSPAVVDAVQGAVRWFNRTQIRGIRVQDVSDPAQPSGKDVVVVADPAAPPLWARFYEIGTDVPFFCGRDGIKKYALAEIENERRVGYSWYSDNPASSLGDYPAWQARWAPGVNALSAP